MQLPAAERHLRLRPLVELLLRLRVDQRRELRLAPLLQQHLPPGPRPHAAPVSGAQPATPGTRIAPASGLGWEAYRQQIVSRIENLLLLEALAHVVANGQAHLVDGPLPPASWEPRRESVRAPCAFGDKRQEGGGTHLSTFTWLLATGNAETLIEALVVHRCNSRTMFVVASTLPFTWVGVLGLAAANVWLSSCVISSRALSRSAAASCSPNNKSCALHAG
jgi:hypothetical protein